MMGSGRPQGSIQKVITTLEFLSVCSGPVRDIYAYWDRRREGRRMPSRTDISAAEFAGHLPGIVFVEVQRDPLNYVYRSVGAREIEARGSDPTGKSVADYWHGGGGMEAVLGNYVIDESLFMPLSPDERTVTDILTYTHYEDIWRKS
jgi:hypothetical protein